MQHIAGRVVPVHLWSANVVSAVRLDNLDVIYRSVAASLLYEAFCCSKNGSRTHVGKLANGSWKVKSQVVVTASPVIANSGIFLANDALNAEGFEASH